MDAMPALSGSPSSAPRLLDQVRGKIRLKHYSLRTEQTYLDWIRRFIRHSGKRHPRELGAAEVEAFLSYLATTRDVAAGTQNQAMHAVLFLYKQVLGIELPWLDGITHAKPSKRLPVVLTQDETRRLLAVTSGTPGLIVRLLYGAGLRLMEGLRLRIKRMGRHDHGAALCAPGAGVRRRLCRERSPHDFPHSRE